MGNSTAGYPVEALDELFTLEEAEMLRDYLERSYGDESVVITERELPIANNTMGLRAIPLGGGQDHYMLDQTPGYSLPFKVRGYFDLRQYWDDQEPAEVDEDGIPY